jgi:hypothetical protein
MDATMEYRRMNGIINPRRIKTLRSPRSLTAAKAIVVAKIATMR